jgi:acetoacetate decarboxylase
MSTSYPPAPWQLYGTAFQTFQFIDLERSRAIVPAAFEIVSILPGKTLSGLYFSVYEGNSTLTYHELIVVGGLVRYGNQIGSWVSHIYVDDPASVAGGRSIWGLPKELAEFEWGKNSVTVMQGDSVLCSFQHGQSGLPLSPMGKSKISGKVFSGLDKDILIFQGKFEAWLKWIHSTVTIPAESPFAMLNLGRPWITLQFRDLHLNAEAPTVVGQWQPDSSRSLVKEL